MILRGSFSFVLALSLTISCFAQQRDIESDKLLNADRLKKTLYAKNIDEKEYCDFIVQKQDDGTIPARLIYGVYRTAMTKDPGRRFAYFQSGLELLCKREGIVLNPKPVKTAPTKPSTTFPSFKSFFQRV